MSSIFSVLAALSCGWGCVLFYGHFFATKIEEAVDSSVEAVKHTVESVERTLDDEFNNDEQSAFSMLESIEVPDID